MTSLPTAAADALTRCRDASPREVLGWMMETLAPREELVLRLRFGLASDAYPRLHVAQLLAVSETTVRRIERQAMRKLRLNALGPTGGGWRWNGWDEA
jgi:DNA-directed RNA polymerase sigma subunit (sigma70/sigma32)